MCERVLDWFLRLGTGNKYFFANFSELKVDHQDESLKIKICHVSNFCNKEPYITAQML